MKKKTILILRNSLFEFVEKKEFESRKKAKEYAIKMKQEKKACMYSLANAKDYSPYFTYKSHFIPNQ